MKTNTLSTFALLSLWSECVFTVTQPTPFGDFYFIGCYNDTIYNRILQGYFYENSNVDNSQCHELCKGFNYFGTEFGNQCFCGNYLFNFAMPYPVTDCNYACAGNEGQYCGASNRTSLYERLLYLPSSTATSTVTLYEISTKTKTVKTTDTMTVTSPGSRTTTSRV